MKNLKLIQTILILFICTASYSQIVFTNIPDTTIYADDTLYLDINSDELNDFFFYVVGPSNHYAKIEALNSNLVASHQEAFGDWVTNFEQNSEIFDELFLFENIGGTLYSGPYSYGFRGCFGGAVDAYIGIKLVADNTYFGWLQVDVSSSGEWITIKGYAYNSTPYESITTPTLTNITYKNNNPTFEIYPIPTSEKIFISSNCSEERIKISILNIEGQIVYQQKINTGNDINVSDLKAGIYFLKIESQNVTFTEKIIKL